MRAYATIEDAMTAGSGIERPFHCGNPDHDDKNASASVNSLTGAFLCYSCGWRGKIDPENFEVNITEAGKFIAGLVERLEATERSLTEAWLAQYDSTGPGDYWLSRFAASTCRMFRLGMDHGTSSATVPVRSLNGKPIGVLRRNLTDVGPKYLYPKDVDISQYLFAYERCTDDVVILTEGATDTIAAWEVGHQAMALYGAHMSRAQKDAIARYAPRALILAFDMDDAGHRAAEHVERLFPELLTVRPMWTGAKDLASMSLHGRGMVLDKARKDVADRLAQTRSNALEFETCESPDSPKTSASTTPFASSVKHALPRLRLRLASPSPSPA